MLTQPRPESQRSRTTGRATLRLGSERVSYAYATTFVSTNARGSAFMQVVAAPRHAIGHPEGQAAFERCERPPTRGVVPGLAVEQLVELLGQHPGDRAISLGGQDFESTEGLGRERKSDILSHVNECST